MTHPVQGLLAFARKNLIPTVCIFAIILILFFFAVPRVIQRADMDYGDERAKKELAYGRLQGGAGGEFIFNGPSEGAETVGGDGSGRALSMPAPASAPMAEEQKVVATDANKASFDLMPSAFAATEIFKPQIIKTAHMTLEVENIVDSVKKIENLTTGHGGLITNKNVSIAGDNNQYRSGAIQVRVPQAQLDKFLDALHSMGIPRQETVSSEDVGAEVVDLQSRIRNAKAQEDVLLGIMKRSGKVPDILQVAQELANVREQVEQMQGRLNFLRQQVSYSTVNIQLQEKALLSPTQGKPGFIDVIGNSAKRAFGDLIDFVNALTAILVGTVIFWLPVLFILWVVATLLWKFIIKRVFFAAKDKCGFGRNE